MRPMSTRVETDSLGPVEVPADVYWGAQTARALRHFITGTDRMPVEVIHALALVKKAVAQVNADLGWLDRGRADVIVRVAGSLPEAQLPERGQIRSDRASEGDDFAANRMRRAASSAIRAEEATTPVAAVTRHAWAA